MRAKATAAAIYLILAGTAAAAPAVPPGKGPVKQQQAAPAPASPSPAPAVAPAPAPQQAVQAAPTPAPAAAAPAAAVAVVPAPAQAAQFAPPQVPPATVPPQAATVVAPAAGANNAPSPDDGAGDPSDVKPEGKGIGTRASHGPSGQAGAPGKKDNGIYYHGGPLTLGTAHVYYIWYGNWVGNSATTILPDLAASIGGSPYYGINTTYYNGQNVRVSNSVAYMGSASDNYTRGASLSDADIQSVVVAAIAAGKLPTDSNGTYFVLTSADVNASSGFCTQYCGWHTHASVNGVDLKYAFVGNPDRCPSACAEQTTGPNGNAGADGMASIIAHELEESVTDPALNAWYNRRGQENADLCAWTFGALSTAANGAKYNMTLGSRNYLIQQNWVNDRGGYCAVSYP
jgi:hypothetical protein